MGGWCIVEEKKNVRSYNSNDILEFLTYYIYLIEITKFYKFILILNITNLFIYIENYFSGNAH